MNSGFYRHRNNTDVAMQVVKSYWIPEKDGYKVKVYWWNIVNPSNQFKLFVHTNYEFVKREDVKNWDLYVDRN